MAGDWLAESQPHAGQTLNQHESDLQPEIIAHLLTQGYTLRLISDRQMTGWEAYLTTVTGVPTLTLL